MRRPAVLALLSMLALPERAWAQLPTDDVGACSLLSDPTAQRACFESARQKRPAASFDPSSVKIRSRRNKMLPVGDGTGLRRTLGDDTGSPVRRRPPPRPSLATPDVGAAPAAAPQMP